MLNITQQQAINRWDKLPMILREAVFSERNADILWGVCESQHLAEDKIYKIATLAGEVIMGFIHPEDLTKEIKEATGIHSDVADIIVKEIDRKIFSLIRSEIDKAYTLPVESEAPEEEIETQAPKIEEDVVTDIRKGDVKITRYGKPVAETTFGAQAVQVGEIEPMKIVSSDGEEKIILSGAESPESISSEAEKIEEKSAKSTAPIMPEGPIVIHKEKEIETAISEKFGGQKPIGDLFGFLNGKKEAPKKEAAAEVELDQRPTPLSSGQAIEKERLVHYDAGLTTQIDANITQANADMKQTGADKKPIGADIQESVSLPEAKKEESKPKLFFKNIIQTFKPMVKVVDFIEQPQIDADKKQIDADVARTDADITQTNADTTRTADADITRTDDKIEIEAPKIIVEEVKEEIKEEKEEKQEKEGFFKKLFKFKKEKPQEIIKEEEQQADIKQKEIAQNKIEQSETEFKETKLEEIKPKEIASEKIKTEEKSAEIVAKEIMPEEIKIEEIKAEEKPVEISLGEHQEKKKGFFGRIFGKSKNLAQIGAEEHKIAIEEKEKEIQEIKADADMTQTDASIMQTIDGDITRIDDEIETKAPKILMEEKLAGKKTGFFTKLFKKNN